MNRQFECDHIYLDEMGQSMRLGCRKELWLEGVEEQREDIIKQNTKKQQGVKTIKMILSTG